MSYLQDDCPNPDSQQAKDRRAMEDWSFLVTLIVAAILIAWEIAK